MHKEIRAKMYRERPEGTYLLVLVPDTFLTAQMKKYADGDTLKGELRIDDGRHIRADQRKKAWAIIGDISDWNGDDDEINHWWLKRKYRLKSGEKHFSLSNCSVSTARGYISFLIDFVFEWNVPLTEPILNTTDDIDAALYYALKHKRCILCGKDGEQHHWQAIGIGRDRKVFDDSNLTKISLCREHHDEAHNIGRDTFASRYHVYGIIFNETKEEVGSCGTAIKTGD